MSSKEPIRVGGCLQPGEYGGIKADGCLEPVLKLLGEQRLNRMADYLEKNNCDPEKMKKDIIRRAKKKLGILPGNRLDRKGSV